jgi:site-specific DNA-adenine methylase
MMQFPYPHVFTQSTTRQPPFVVGLKPPFPWFGGKRRVAHLVWERFGDIYNYVEPFFGSGAVLFNRPHEPRIETVNDKDKYLANFWRATQHDPAGVAKYADWPVNEADLHARHKWLVAQTDFNERMSTDPDYYDVKIAGWWVWGLSAWIGHGWCSGVESNQRPPLGRRAQQGIHSVPSKRPHLGDAANKGIHRTSEQLPQIGRPSQKGVHSMKLSRPMLFRDGRGVHSPNKTELYAYFDAIAARLRRVRVICGDWARVLGPTPTYKSGLTAVFLDPPYSEESGRDTQLYAAEDTTIAHAVRQWALENGDNPKMRIALCGYEGEHAMPDNWECVAWKANGGYGNQSKTGNDNNTRERIWFSPHCLKVERDKQLTFELIA